MGPTGTPETSVSNHLTPRDNAETEKFDSTAAEIQDFANTNELWTLFIRLSVLFAVIMCC